MCTEYIMVMKSNMLIVNCDAAVWKSGNVKDHLQMGYVKGMLLFSNEETK